MKLWTHFVTPRGDQTQQDQTKQVSYYKKEESEELDYLDYCSMHSDLVKLLFFSLASRVCVVVVVFEEMKSERTSPSNTVIST